MCREDNYRRHVQEWRTGYGNSRPRSLVGRGKWKRRRQCHLRARLSCYEHPQKFLQGRGNPGSFCRQRCRGELGELAGASSERAAYRNRYLALGDAKGRRRNNCLVSLVSVYPGGGGPHERTTCNLISGSYRVNGARFCSGARVPMRRGRPHSLYKMDERFAKSTMNSDSVVF